MCMQFWQGSCGSWPAFCETLGQFLLVVMVQGGQLMSFGRATYGRAGRLDVDPKGDDSNPEARPVDNLDGATVRGMAAGEVHPPPPPPPPPRPPVYLCQCLSYTVTACAYGCSQRGMLADACLMLAALPPLALYAWHILAWLLR